MSGAKWTYTTKRKPARKPRYQVATLLWVGDRCATAVPDGNTRHVDVIVPNGLWVFPGNRVALTRYPYGWVVVGGWIREARR